MKNELQAIPEINERLEELIRSTHPPKIQNVVSTVDLGTELNLVVISNGARMAEYNPKRFSAVIMRLSNPSTTALIFQSGKMVCTGAKSEDQSLIAARKYAKIINKLGFPVVTLLQASTSESQSNQTNLLKDQQYRSVVQYEPEIFPGLIFRKITDQKKITLLIFVSGRCVITGGKKTEDLNNVFKFILPILDQFKKRDLEY
ncbi:unnamed protein product (macronuclear) [Paramecium tetraurelia]|uniref:TATA-box-binding protein n=1 Tax=Paramecium tetraurelia TaxID=5888 RepID=A0CRU8_PARTE|nr:uncharacterized protein GSPATT00009830001 [Paramecium tetraurelia]CAK73515.1 unnamed protein product [Paramecium tetraurelia]|eukprot:XP_001440912.1 hypothetical protein (macronuclear) [Paramecium tetraurelia strain d4-2]